MVYNYYIYITYNLLLPNGESNMYQIMLIEKPNQIVKSWVVYSIHDAVTAKVKFVGHCKLTQLFSIPDARANLTVDDDEPIIIRALDMCKNKVEAIRAHSKRAKELGVTKQLATARMKRSGIIECIDTGERFNTIGEVCDAHGATPSAMSHHLRGTPGHVTVKNKVYRRINT